MHSTLTLNKLLSFPVISIGQFSPLTHAKFNNVFCNLLQQAGVKQSYYMLLSFQIGTTTIAASAGLPS